VAVRLPPLATSSLRDLATKALVTEVTYDL
jgi:hypothetical protein